VCRRVNRNIVVRRARFAAVTIACATISLFLPPPTIDRLMVFCVVVI